MIFYCYHCLFRNHGKDKCKLYALLLGMNECHITAVCIFWIEIMNYIWHEFLNFVKLIKLIRLHTCFIHSFSIAYEYASFDTFQLWMKNWHQWWHMLHQRYLFQIVKWLYLYAFVGRVRPWMCLWISQHRVPTVVDTEQTQCRPQRYTCLFSTSSIMIRKCLSVIQWLYMKWQWHCEC